MANKYLDTAFVDKAIKFAVDAHANTERRGKGFPYVIHVLEAMEIVATLTNDPELLAAAALHDTVEDTDVTVDQIRSIFGNRVAAIVDCESDKFEAGVSEEDSWRGRKQAAIDRLKNASMDSKIVAMGDKLSNMRAIARDYQKQGDELWSLFHAPGGKADHEWHYRNLAASLSDLSGTPAFSEFVNLIGDVFGDPKPVLIDIEDYEESGSGFTAISYNHKTRNVMMKLYSHEIPASVPIHELKTNWAILELGLDIPAAHKLVTDGDRIGVQFDRIAPKKSIARAICDDPQNIGIYMERFTQKCKELHNTPCNTDMFPSISRTMSSAVQQCTILDQARKDKMLEFIKGVPDAKTCIHGDMQIGNMILNTDSNELFWIDLADFSYGHPNFDLAMFYLVCNKNPEALTYELYHITKEQTQQAWSLFVSSYFAGKMTTEQVDEMLAPYAAILLVRFTLRHHLPDSMWEFVLNTFNV